MREVAIRQEPIELCQFLKLAALVQSGGEAKAAISEGLVRVNGDVETRKRKKIAAGDTIEYGGECFRIVRG